MITTYIEIHHDRDNSRNIIPIENIGGVAEVQREVDVIENGKPVKRLVTKTQILINNVPYFVRETYDEVKGEINIIRWSLDGLKEQRINLLVEQKQQDLPDKNEQPQKWWHQLMKGTK
jgi:hypothetical protein